MAGDERRLVRATRTWTAPATMRFSAAKSDNIVGGEGNDWLFGMLLTRILQRHALWWFRQRRDERLAQTAAAVKDVVACGSGFDRVIADRATLVAPDCEKVVVVHGSKENAFEQSDAFYESIPQSFLKSAASP